MRITKISGYRQDQPFRDGPYICSGGRSALGFDSLVVRIDTNRGITGWGEMAPLGAFYDPAFAAGARSAFAELAPKLLGSDPSQLVALDRQMEFLLKGHPYAKAAIARRENLKRSADELRAQLEDAKMALGEAFDELKKVELLDERDQMRERETENAAEQAELDSIALMRVRSA